MHLVIIYITLLNAHVYILLLDTQNHGSGVREEGGEKKKIKNFNADPVVSINARCRAGAFDKTLLSVT